MNSRLAEPLAKLMEANADLNRQRDAYECHSGGWALAGWYERVDEAEKALEAEINRMIDERITEKLGRELSDEEHKAIMAEIDPLGQDS